jgi:hypothetical protein
VAELWGSLAAIVLLFVQETLHWMRERARRRDGARCDCAGSTSVAILVVCHRAERRWRTYVSRQIFSDRRPKHR